MRCQVCGGRVHTEATCRHFAPRRAARRVPAVVVVGCRWVVGLVGVFGAGRAFDAANEGAGSWLGVFVGLGFTFAAVVWPSSSSQEKRG